MFTEEEDEEKYDTNHEIAYEPISRGVFEASTMLLGIWIALYWPVSDLRLILKAWASIFTKFSGVLYVDHVRFDPCHPYIECLPML